MFNVGDKVVDLNSGDIGTITRRATEDDPGVIDLQCNFECCWYVLWETGSESGKELWLPEEDLAIYTPVEVTEENEYLEKIKQLEAEVKFLKGMLSNVQNWR